MRGVAVVIEVILFFRFILIDGFEVNLDNSIDTASSFTIINQFPIPVAIEYDDGGKGSFMV